MFHDGFGIGWSSTSPRFAPAKPALKDWCQSGLFSSDHLSARGGGRPQVFAVCPKADGNCGGAMVFLWHAANGVPPAGSERTGAPAWLGQAAARCVPENVGHAEPEGTGLPDCHAPDCHAND